jgi:hypothetical protein
VHEEEEDRMERVGQFLPVLRALLLASLAGGAAAGPAGAQAEREEADWLAARADGSHRAYERYLQRHPLGGHAGEAFAVISRMAVDPGWSPDPAVAGPEPSAGPDRSPGTDVY